MSRCLAPHKEGQSVLWAKKEKLASRLKREKDFLVCILFPALCKQRKGGRGGTSWLSRRDEEDEMEVGEVGASYYMEGGGRGIAAIRD